MTTEELREIVSAVMQELESSGVDFDYTIQTAEDTDLVFVIRGNAPDYQGKVITWKGLLDIITAKAEQAKTDAVTAKNIAQEILTGVQNKGTEITNFVATSKSEIETQKNESVNAVKSVYQTDLNELKGDLTITINAVKKELDEKKITKFYASNNGNTNLPDSDNGKPSDMKIFGKSVQDGTPSPDAPIEIQSVVNPVVRMEGKNLATINNFINTDSYSEIIPVTLKKGVGYTCSAKINKNTTLRLKFTDGTYQYVENKSGNTTQFKASFVLNMDVVNISFYNVLTVSDLQIEYGSVATEYKRYQEPSSASIPYTLNAIPVTSEGNVTIDGQQYIADYVDIEKKQLIRNVGEVDLGTLEFTRDGITYRNQLSNFKTADNTKPIYALCEKYYPVSYNSNWNKNGMMSQDSSSKIIFVNSKLSSASEFKQSVSGTKLLYALATPTITDLTDEQVQAFRKLVTHYPITNVFMTSDQLDGYTTFNYPLNMANGWNYVMQQIGETRPIIYDTQVKTIENIIDTAILTAMMEA